MKNKGNRTANGIGKMRKENYKHEHLVQLWGKTQKGDKRGKDSGQ